MGPPHDRFASQRGNYAGAQPNRLYSATARTSRCVSGFYQTQATAIVAGRRLVARSRPRVIVCDAPVDLHCDVTADAPSLARGVIVGQSELTCAADRNDLLWTVHLEVNINGQWSARPAAGQDGFPYHGGTTYHQSVRDPCSSEPPPWPREVRTVVELKPARGTPSDRTSPATSIDCPAAAHTLTVTLTGTGSGRVTSSPAGIDCPGACSHAYPAGTTITLTATPAANSRFASWTGQYCGGQGACQFPLLQDSSVGADFESNSHP